ncbi:hypothetical protein KGA66_24520 [Actinocrinis puniceicyclus]|uniref:Uncharacterized protein n=1 Tax=Actinocrinis puniceicyclus TaxID=977794 RepID=A0A8J8BDG9_9ACTN|nr:hypothetical protein [Actinocrinis puniceicyclus]MBS2966232.1 hypothetical protein [Actinocrinis puniceicyclus]
MGRITGRERERNEAALRAAMDRLLSGAIPPGGGCDLKTLAAEAGVTRTGFYPKGERPGPYQHLAEEFERRRAAMTEAGQIPDPRDAQISRLKRQNAALRERLAERDTQAAQHEAFKRRAISQLAAQHEEIQRLRSTSLETGNVRSLRSGRQR